MDPQNPKPDDLETHVTAMLNAGVAESEITKFIEEYGAKPNTGPRPTPTLAEAGSSFWEKNPNAANIARAVTGTLPFAGAVGAIPAAMALAGVSGGAAPFVAIPAGAAVGKGAEDAINELTGLTPPTSMGRKGLRMIGEGAMTASGIGAMNVLADPVRAARAVARPLGAVIEKGLGGHPFLGASTLVGGLATGEPSAMVGGGAALLARPVFKKTGQAVTRWGNSAIDARAATQANAIRQSEAYALPRTDTGTGYPTGPVLVGTPRGGVLEAPVGSAGRGTGLPVGPPAAPAPQSFTATVKGPGVSRSAAAPPMSPEQLAAAKAAAQARATARPAPPVVAPEIRVNPSTPPSQLLNSPTPSGSLRMQMPVKPEAPAVVPKQDVTRTTSKFGRAELSGLSTNDIAYLDWRHKLKPGQDWSKVKLSQPIADDLANFRAKRGEGYYAFAKAHPGSAR